MTGWPVRSSLPFLVLAVLLSACSDPTRSAEYRDLQDRYDAARAQVVDLEARLGEALDHGDASDRQVADLTAQLEGARREVLSSQAQLDNRIALDRFWPVELASGFTDTCVRLAPDTLTDTQQRTSCACVLSLLETNVGATDFALLWVDVATAPSRDPVTGLPTTADPETAGWFVGAVATCRTPWLVPAP
jgi:hypothetical protein